MLTSIRCPSCGAFAAYSPERGGAGCAHCGAWAAVDAETNARVRHHLAKVDLAQTEARHLAQMADQTRATRFRGLSCGVSMLTFAVLMSALPTLVSVMLPVGLSSFLEGLSYLGAMVLAIAASFGVLHGVSLLEERAVDRNKIDRPKAKTVVAVGRCGSCGATVPVLAGQEPACPFCEAALVPTSEAMAAVERQLEGVKEARRGEVDAESAALIDSVKRRARLFHIGLAVFFVATFIIPTLVATIFFLVKLIQGDL